MPRIFVAVFLCAGALLGGPALAGNICLKDAGDPTLSFPGGVNDYVFAVKPDGNGGYGISFCSPTTLDLSWFTGYSIADFNHDGWQDLLLGVKTNSGGEVQLFLNDKTGSGTVVLDSTLPTGAAAAPSVVASPDLNGDGWPDIVTANGSDGTFSVMLNDGTGAFPSVKQYAAGSDVTLLAVWDLNGDNRPDVVTVSAQDKTAAVFINNGDGTFAAPVTYSTGLQASSLIISDINGDGHPDITLAASNGAWAQLMNMGDGAFVVFTHPSGFTSSGGSAGISGAGADVSVSVTTSAQLLGGSGSPAVGGTISLTSGIGKITTPTLQVTKTSSGSSAKGSSSSAGSASSGGGGTLGIPLLGLLLAAAVARIRSRRSKA